MSGRQLIRVATGLACALVLAGCSDRQQASQFFQDFTDTKHGPTGVISNTLSPGTGNPQADAALGAGDVIRNVERSDALESEATIARDKGDGATALVKVKEAVALRPNPYVNLTHMGIALQYAPPAGNEFDSWVQTVSGDMGAIHNRALNLRSGEHVKPEDLDYLDAGVIEIERSLKALANMDRLLPRERRERQGMAAYMAKKFYTYRALLHQRNGNGEHEEADRLKAELYGRMAESLAVEEPVT